MAKYRKVLPRDIDRVVSLYRAGMSMKSVSEMTGISKTKVSIILHQANSPDNEIFLCHFLAANLNKAGITLREYADLIRAKNLFTRLGIQPTIVLALVRKVIELCFKNNLEPILLATSFNNFHRFVSSFASMSPENLQRALTFELKYLQNIMNDLDPVLDTCKQLNGAIEILERLASLSSNPMGKH